MKTLIIIYSLIFILIFLLINKNLKNNDKKPIIIIDPGHGGKDVGAVGLHSLTESKIVLDVSLKIKEKLEKKRLTVILTRYEDEYISLLDRLKKGYIYDGNLFVSVHANGHKNSNINGIETFYFMNSGKILAQKIQNQLIKKSKNSIDRGIKKKNFFVLRTEIVSCLVEIGFITGTEDYKNLLCNKHKKSVADAISEGVLEYLKN